MNSTGPADPSPTAGPNAERNDFPADLHCPICAYCLQGLPGDTCPECGQSLASLRSTVSRIPWQSRREIGRVRAYWRTVWMVTVRNRQFCEEYARPVSYRDARSFQLVTVMHVFLAAVLAVALLYISVSAKPEAADSILEFILSDDLWLGPTQVDRAYAEIWPAVGLLICFLLFLAAATGVPSYFFHPRSIAIRQQNTAIAMSHYTCGPLALAPILIAVAFMAIWPVAPEDAKVAAVALAVIKPLVLAALLWWLNLVRLAHRTMPQIKGRAILVGLATPLLWLALAGLLLVLLPLAILWILVVIYSLA